MHSGQGERGVTSPLGIILIFGMTLLAATAIVVIGSAAFEATQQDTRVSQAEQALTQFDSKAAQVALGETDSQQVNFGQNGGSYSVDEESGTLRIIHQNWSEGEDQYLYEGTLGAVVYDSGDTTLAYQGGGVWRLDNDGAARMISPPEFHYRGATLTFPIITVTADGVQSGDRSADVSHTSTSGIFPNASAEYTDDEPFTNPIAEGELIVEIESEYCEGWWSYFDSRSEGNITECEDDTVQASLETFGDKGELSITGGTISPRGVGEVTESVLKFSHDDSGQNSDFNNFEWSLYGESGDQQFEIYAAAGGGTSEGDPLTIVVYYSEDGGDTFDMWVNETEFTVEVDEDGEFEYVIVDMLSDVEMQFTDEYAEHGNADGREFSGDEFNESPSFELSSSDEPIANITQAYLPNLDDMDFETQERSNANMGDASNWEFDYDGDGRVITYLHITENEVAVRLR